MSRKSYEKEAAPGALDKYYDEIRNLPVLTPEEEHELAVRVTEGDEDAKNRLCECNLRLVVSIAAKFTGRGLALEDLIQEGNIGMMHAIDKFDPCLGTKFSTYATPWIRQAVQRAIANQGRTIRLPVNVVEDINRIKGASALLEQALGREPAIREIADAVNMEPEKVAELISSSQAPASLFAPTGCEDIRIADTIEDTKAIPPDLETEKSDPESIIEALLLNLTDRESLVLRRRFGLGDGKPMTLEAIGSELGITRERVRQIEAKAIRKLKKAGRMGKLAEYAAAEMILRES